MYGSKVLFYVFVCALSMSIIFNYIRHLLRSMPSTYSHFTYNINSYAHNSTCCLCLSAPHRHAHGNHIQFSSSYYRIESISNIIVDDLQSQQHEDFMVFSTFPHHTRLPFLANVKTILHILWFIMLIVITVLIQRVHVQLPPSHILGKNTQLFQRVHFHKFKNSNSLQRSSTIKTTQI